MKYYEKIDGLRFVAISLVFFEHFAYSAIGKYISAGYYGVDLFFVISGFLITSILIKPNDNSFKKNYINFIGRRTLRIFPIYYITIFVLWLTQLSIIHDKLIWFLTYTYNYAWDIYQIPDNPVNHFWSLCVEEQFYLFWPLVVLSFKKKPTILIFITCVMIVSGYAQLSYNIFPSISKFNFHGLFTRMSSLALGALGSILYSKNMLPEKVFRSKAIEYIVFFILLINLVFYLKLKFVFIGLCSLFIVLKAAYYDFSIPMINRFLKNKKIIYLGTITYGIYIFHVPIAYYFSKFIFDPIWLNIDFSRLGRFEKIRWYSWIIKLPLFSFLSIVAASLSFKYIERPILKLKDRYFRY